MPATARILVVRHGESEWNAVGRWQGHADPPLSRRGEDQARSAARHLGAMTAVVSSDLQRAAATATIVAAEAGIPNVIIEPRLRERDAGEWTGLTRAEIEEQYPGFLAEGRRPPGFERGPSLFERVQPCLLEVGRDRAGGNVLAVTHAGVILSLEAALGLPREILPNLAGRWFDVSDAGLVPGERVVLVDPHEAPVTTPRSE